MAALHQMGMGMGIAGTRTLPPFEGLRVSVSALSFRVSPAVGAMGVRFDRRNNRSLAVKAATVVAPKYTSIKPLGDRVLVKIKSSEEKTTGGILLPTAAQSKPQRGEVVAVGEGRTIGKAKVEISVPAGTQVVYSKYAGTELEFNGVNHLLLKEDDIVGIHATEDIKDLKPLNDRVLIKVVATGPGPLDEEGNRKPPGLTPGSTVLYSKYAGSEFKGVGGTEYIALRASDVIAVLSS